MSQPGYRTNDISNNAHDVDIHVTSVEFGTGDADRASS